MDPHDQQECVSSGKGFETIAVRADSVIPYSSDNGHSRLTVIDTGA